MSGKRNSQQSDGISIGDIYFVVFRQKWIIISAIIVAIIAAAVLCVMKPAQYQSETELLVRYVVDKTLGSANNDMAVRSPERGDTIMDTEVAILTSLDLVQPVVQEVGAKNILAKINGSDDTNAAAGVILKNMFIDPVTKGSILHVSYQNPDPAVAQNVLREIIRIYYKNHNRMHQAVGGEFLTTETKRLRTELDETEKDLREAKSKAGVISLDEAKKSSIEQMTKVREDILNAEAELAEHRAALNGISTGPQPSATNAATANVVGDVPAAKMREYQNICMQLGQDTRDEQNAIVVRKLREDSIYVLDIRDQITKDERAKKQLEDEFPKLAGLAVVAAPATGGQSSVAGVDLAVETARVRMLEGKTNRLHMQLAQIRAEASKLEDVESPIEELQRRKDLKEATLRHFLSTLEQNKIDEALGMGKGSDEISVVENPTPPIKKRPKTFKKLLGAVVGGCIVAGFGLAFLIEMLFDHTVRRPVDVERKLKLPLFVSIPNMHADGRKHGTAQLNGKSTLLLREANGEALTTTNGDGAPGDAGAVEIPPWDPDHALNRFYAGLRERLIVNFEVRNLTHNPKLVAVTSCNKGAGVSSIAAGLAASLSETGDGNVLLVDMNMEQHTAQQFYKGKPGCGLDAALEAETMNNAMVSENFYVASEGASSHGNLARVLPKRFASLMPKLKASDYDYIIFDMPPVSQTSTTPRLAGLMDMVLLVIESEKTSREAVQRANALLAESKANVSAVLNKTKSYVPSKLHQEFLNDA